MTESNTNVHQSSNHSAQLQIIDVRSKIIATFLVILAGSFLVDLNQLFWFLLIFFFYFVIFQPRLLFIKQCLATFPIIISLTLISFFSFSRSPLIYRSLFYSTIHNNFSFALFSASRSLLMILFVLMLINSEESFFEIIYGLNDLKMPDLLTSLTFFTYRFFFLMQEELERILEARANRLYGERLRMNFRSMKIIGNIIGGLLARSFKRAEYVSATLSARGFSGKLLHPHQPWTMRGIIFLIIIILILIVIMNVGQVSPITFLKEFL